jgi:hypothetical protein
VTLEQRHEEIFEDLKEQLGVLAGKYPVVEMGAIYEQIEECFKALACCHLLRNADPAKFQRNLIWSALGRREFLLRCELEKNQEDHRRARSRSDAVFAALAAGDSALAREVGDRAPMDRIREGEYQDDFAYHMLIYEILREAAPAMLATALAAYETALDGGPSERLTVCTALTSADGPAFEEAFQALLSAQVTKMEDERAVNEAVATFEPQSRLFIEGLALLRLAEQRGIVPSSPEYPLCPSMARVGPPQQRPDDIFAEL